MTTNKRLKNETILFLGIFFMIVGAIAVISSTAVVIGSENKHKREVTQTINTNLEEKAFNVGYECGEILTKLDSLADNGNGVYKELSDRYFVLGCASIDFYRERDKYGRDPKYARCEFMDDDCYRYVDQGITSCDQFIGDEKEMCYGDLEFWRANRENR